MMAHGESRLRRLLVFQLPLLVVTVVTLFPLAWMLVVSFKRNEDLYNPRLNPYLPTPPDFSHYLFLVQRTNFPMWFLNSALTTAVAVGFSLFASVLAGYALSRLRFPGASLIGWLMFITYLIPGTLLFLPLTRVVNGFHLLNTRPALMLTYPTFLIPFCTWYLMGYYRSIPGELEEAARIDGATRLVTLVRIVLPLATPGILAVGIFAFTQSWNEFLYSLIFITDSARRTLPVGVTSELIRGDTFLWGELMAASVLGSLPVVVLYIFFVDRIIPGLTAGSVRG